MAGQADGGQSAGKVEAGAIGQVTKEETKKRAAAKPRASKGAAKGKKTVKSEANDESEEEHAVQTMVKFEGGENEDGALSDIEQDSEAFGAYIAEGKGHVSKKRSAIDEWASGVSSSGSGEEVQLDVETPAKPATESNGRAAKKSKV